MAVAVALNTAGRYNGARGFRCSMRHKEEGDLVGPVQAAEILGVGRSTLWRGSNDGTIPVYTWLPQRGGAPYRAIYSRKALLELKAKWDAEGRLERMRHKRPRNRPSE